MKREPNLANTEQRELFRQSLDYWQVKLNLVSWRFFFSSAKASAAMANVKIQVPDHLAVFRLGDFKATPITPESLDETALHESLHVLLADFKAVCQNPDSSEDVVNAAEHSVINVLERLLAPSAR